MAKIEHDRLASIEDKPRQASSPYAVAGVYLYDASVFGIIKDLEPSGRGELEITDVNNSYLQGNSASYRVLEGWWTDASSFESLAAASELASRVELPLFEAAKSHGSGLPSTKP